MVFARIILIASMVLLGSVTPFRTTVPFERPPAGRSVTSTQLQIATQVSEAEAKKGIDKVVNALRKDKAANKELGRLDRVTVVLGFGMPTPGILNLRFNASFKKSGRRMSAVPMPFMLGQTNQGEGRGKMVGQVKASVDTKTGRVTSCSVFKDLGYGNSFMLKV